MRSSCKGRREQRTSEMVLFASRLASLASFVEVWKTLCLDFCLPPHPSKGGLAWRLGKDCALAAIEIGDRLCIDYHIELCPGARRAEVVDEIVKGFGRVGD